MPEHIPGAGTLDELFALLRIESVSALPAHAGDMLAAADWCATKLRGAGGTAEIVRGDGETVVVGELTAARPGAPVVLAYGHYDVQPAGSLADWTTPPFEPTVRDGWLYARGAADSKANLHALLTAACELAAADALPVTVRFLLDGAEEIAGRLALDVAAEHAAGAAAAIVYDGSTLHAGVPTLWTGCRGLAYWHVRLRTADRELHSGGFGGAALNACHALVETLRPLVATDGGLPGELRRGTGEPTAAELDSWALLPAGDELLAAGGGRPAGPAAAAAFHRLTRAEPSADVHSLAVGAPGTMQTAIPPTAEATLSMRLAHGQDVAEIDAAMRRLLTSAAPAGAEIDVELVASAAAAHTPADHPALLLAREALRRASGREPLVATIGATLPLLATLSQLGVPTAMLGFAGPGANAHGPNERIALSAVEAARRTASELLRAFAQLPGPTA